MRDLLAGRDDSGEPIYASDVLDPEELAEVYDARGIRWRQDGAS